MPHDKFDAFIKSPNNSLSVSNNITSCAAAPMTIFLPLTSWNKGITVEVTNPKPSESIYGSVQKGVYMSVCDNM